MAVEVIGVFIPIIFILITGLVIVTAIYLRSREKQMLIEKGLTPEQIKEFFESKRRESSPYTLAKIGVIAIFFGIGLGLGLYLEDVTDREYWNPLCIFIFTGAGFVIANLWGRKLEKAAINE